MIYSDEMAYSESVTTTFVAMTGSPYYPLVDGRLIQVKLGVSGDAVTSLMENTTVKLTSPKWGVPLYVTCEGSNLRTLPTLPIPKGVQNCDLPVKTGSKITIEVMCRTGATPVTPRYQLIGVFEG